MTSKKAQKCVRCFGTVKADKGISCPGCSQLYCWRCEKKAFDACPNGEQCVHPIRRCSDCCRGNTFLDTMKEREGFVLPDIQKDPIAALTATQSAISRFRDVLRLGHNNLSYDAMPVAPCHACTFGECTRCFDDPAHGRIYQCHECNSSLCTDCSAERLRVFGKTDEVCTIFARLINKGPKYERLSSEDISVLSAGLRGTSSGAVVRCHTPTCNFTCCVACADDPTVASIVKTVTSKSVVPFLCTRCYWSAKPCTNPSCPNEVGVPTKRCGGCHIDRYCSVECQMAAYPAHVNRCNKIQKKRKISFGDKGDQDE